jgi:pantoate--beta-alanine ligase
MFGQKEVQQSAVVRKMIADLHFGVEVVVVPTVREEGGLACDVRNHSMTTNQRTEALSIPASLKQAQEMVATGVRSADRIMAEVTHILSQHRRVRVIYVSIVDSTTMEAMREVVPGRSLLAIAAWVDEVRLTDNVLL